MSDDVQRLRHWQIKDFPEDKRKLVTQAAYQSNKTVAGWLEPVIDAALTDGQVNARVTTPVNQDVDELCRLVSAACEFAQHREQMQRDLAAAISRRLKRVMEQQQTGLPHEVNHHQQMEARLYPQVVAS